MIGFKRIVYRLLFKSMVRKRIHIPDRMAIDDNLRALIAVRFQQYGSHIGMGFDSTGECLHCLRAANFTIVYSDSAIQRHILWFNGCYPISL